MHDLEGDIAIMPEIFRQVYGRHSPARNFALDPISICE
jgi:hypothetical protein